MSFKIKKDPKKWIIAGTGDSWQLIPNESEKTICCLNDFVRTERYQVKMDYLFMMDILDEKPSVVSGQDNLGEMIAKVNQMKVPFVAPYKYEEIPLSEAFPLKEVVDKFGLAFFTNTICYMIAYALLKGAEEIELYGVNQAGSHEYTEERGGVEAWLALAMGLGVKVTVNGKNSQLFRYKGRYGGQGEGILYGYLQTYEDVLIQEQKFGETKVRKLLKSPAPYSRQFRTFKTK